MATRSKPSTTADKPATGLRHSDIPGVYLNAHNVPCNEQGIALGFADIKKADHARLHEAGDAAVTTPAGFLRAVALDPRQPTYIRMEAAKAAAPYYDRRMSLGVDGGLGEDGKPIPLMDLSALSAAELDHIAKLLAKAGVPL